MLPDYIQRNCRILFVGLNPGLRSAKLQHHFAGHTNKFWKLMGAAGFVPQDFNFTNDRDLPRLGWGITNLVGRATSGASDLGPRDYERGRRLLLAKIRKHKPELVALIGLMVFRELFQCRASVRCGRQEQTIEGIPCFVLPNPSGRNAHFSYDQMLDQYISLRKLIEDKEEQADR